MDFNETELQHLLQNSPLDVIRVIHDEQFDKWKTLIGSFNSGRKKDKKDGYKLLTATVQLLGSKICMSLDPSIIPEEEEGSIDLEMYREKQMKILLATSSEKNFFLEISNGISQLHTMSKLSSMSKSLPLESNTDYLRCIHKVCDTFLDKLPYVAKDILPTLVYTAIGTTIASSNFVNDSQNLLDCYKNLQERIQEIEKGFEEVKPKRQYGFTEEYERLLHEADPPEDFRTISIIPSMSELINDKNPFLRPNKVKGAYKYSEHYLDVQFRLLREDFVQPLRKGIHEFLQNKEEYLKTNGRRKLHKQQNTNVRLYSGLKFKGMKKMEDNIKHNFFELPPLYQKVNWEKSKRLLSGSLVMLTSDFCKTAIFAITIAAPEENQRRYEKQPHKDFRRRELMDGVLRVCIETGEDLLDSAKSYTMFENEAYFEAYRYNLNILQKTNLDMNNVIMNKYIVKASSSVDVPGYAIKQRKIQNDTDEDNLDEEHELPCFRSRYENFLDNGDQKNKETLSELRLPIVKEYPVYGPQTFLETVRRIRNREQQQKTVKIAVKVPITDQREMWPKSVITEALGLDDNQYEAYRTALTSELSIIQGPPGTGKTFIGLQIVKTLLINRKGKLDYFFSGVVPRAPLLVLCYTNHALDQFLELLLKEIKALKIVRVGGMCKSEALSSFTLQKHRRDAKRGFEKLNRSLHNETRAESQAGDRVAQLKNEVHTLKVELRELSSPGGIFNFHSMTAEREFFKLLPWADFLKNTTWLNLTDNLFTSPWFDLSDLLIRWFNINPRSLLTKVGTDHTSKSENKGESVPRLNSHELNMEGIPEDMENYDMNELMEHRLFDDYYESIEDDRQSKSSSRDVLRLYLYKYSITGCRESSIFLREHLEKNMSTLENNKKLTEDQWQFLIREIDQNQKDIFEFENRAKLLASIFNLFKQEFTMPRDEDRMLVQNESGTYELNRLRKQDDVSILSFRQMWILYFDLVEIMRELTREHLAKTERTLEQAYEVFNVARQRLDGYIMMGADIIGMTTTGAAKHHALLEIAKPEIVIVEEAAEILEAHVITSLTQDCKQLLLIGDHLQLRPSTNVFQLGTKYHLNVSLFERMILNKVNLCTLKTQHRMRPEIANLIKGTIYEELHDHDVVLKYPPVKGIEKNLFFISHTEKEDPEKDALAMSKSNHHEADFLAGLCEYLLQQGYEPNQITILTTYTGQMFLLKKVVSIACRGVRITCVDNYQGEENDIILLSLVRSNEEDKIGFVGVDNRICVSLSRAKHGLFIIGNLKSLISRSQTWREINQKLKDGGYVGEYLELKCQMHGKITTVKRREDFTPLINGGCTQICKKLLKECAHTCPQVCHALDLDHESYKCFKPCEKKCERGHNCVERCYKPCPKCIVPVQKKLTCSYEHEISLPCHQDPKLVMCPVIVPKIIPKCGHEIEIPCPRDPNYVPCSIILPKIIPKCGHEVRLPCPIDHNTYKCRIKVARELPCEFLHVKELECHRDPTAAKCTILVDRMMRCGHTRAVECQKPVGESKCDEYVEKVYEECGHQKRMVCWMAQTELCKDKCEGVLPCGHNCKETCHAVNPSAHQTKKCYERCKKSCDEGHPCTYNHSCHEKCPPCMVQVSKSLPCNSDHFAVLPCHDDGISYKCPQQVIKNLNCGHKATAECHLDTDQIACYSETKKSLNCGHTAMAECHMDPDSIMCRLYIQRPCVNCGRQRYVICCFQNIMGCLDCPHR